MRHPLLRLVLALALSGLLAWLLPARGAVDGWSLFPPAAALLAATLTGRLVLGLSAAVLAAAALSLPPQSAAWLWPWALLRHAAVDFVWIPLRDSFQLYILGFTAALIGMVRIISLSGGTQGIAALLSARAEGARSTRVAAFLLGLAIFFDDYANTLVVGATMRPITDRFHIAREKLAYIVDSTAAPVAGVALISTWIGYEVGLFDEIMRQVGGGLSGYELFFRALPARFYCLLTLWFVGLCVLLRRDFGPMLRAERRAHRLGQVLAPGARPLSGRKLDDIQAPPGIEAHWSTAAAPVALVVFSVLLGIQWDAWKAPEVVAARRQYAFSSHFYWTAVFSNADAARVMFWSALSGSLLAFLIALSRCDRSGRHLLGAGQIAAAWLRGITGFYYALLILVLAWSIKEACKAVHTSDYLVALLSTSLEPALLPLLVFLLAAATSFAIGTSWATMAILLPTALPLAFHLGGPALGILAAAAVLDGSIFGDHCSPISDTTVLSSIASACDHIAHIKTQLPYALLTMAMAALCGYLGSALLYAPVVGLALGALLLLAALLLAGKDPEAEAR